MIYTGDKMNEELIRNYAKLMKELELTALEINEDNISIRLERNNAVNQVPVAVQADASADSYENDIPYTDKITSPMVGVFYEAPAENADPL